MPSDSNGVYTLPPGYLAQTGQTILASQHNPPLEDLAASMTQRVMATGVTPFTGPAKFADGSAAAPSITLASALNSGFYKHPSGAMGMKNVVGGTPLGAVIDFAGPTAPTGWLFCFGQGLAVADYPDLYGVLGVTYGGSAGLFFLLPDLRATVVAGRSNMGGTERTVMTGVTALGSFVGIEHVTLSIGEMPAHSHPGTTDLGGVDHTHPGALAAPPSTSGQFSGLISPNNGWGGVPSTGNTGAASAKDHTHTFTTGNSGVGGAHNNVQPTTILNKIIFAGI